MKALRSSCSLQKNSACPDAMCSTRPWNDTVPSGIAGRNWTTNARFAGRGLSVVSGASLRSFTRISKNRKMFRSREYCDFAP